MERAMKHTDVTSTSGSTSDRMVAAVLPVAQTMARKRRESDCSSVLYCFLAQEISVALCKCRGTHSHIQLADFGVTLACPKASFSASIEKSASDHSPSGRPEWACRCSDTQLLFSTAASRTIDNPL